MAASRYGAGAAAVPTGRPLLSRGGTTTLGAGRGACFRPIAVAPRGRRSRAGRDARLPRGRAGPGVSRRHRLCRGQGGGFRGLEGRPGVRLQGRCRCVPARSSSARVAQGNDAVRHRFGRSAIPGADPRDLQRNHRHVRKALEGAPAARRRPVRQVSRTESTRSTTRRSGQARSRTPSRWRKRRPKVHGSIC